MNSIDTFVEVVNVQLVSERKIYSDNKINSPEDAVRILGNEICKYNRECLAIINLQTDSRIINFNICSIGSINATIASTAEIFKCALLSNAANIMVMHNHPSGNTSPSNDDILVTRRIAEACRIMDIGLLDHIIVGENGKYYSFGENDMLDVFGRNLDIVGEVKENYSENMFTQNRKMTK